MTVPPAVALAAMLAARDHVGIIGYRVKRTSQITAGPYNRRDDVTLAVIFQNDQLISMRILSDRIDGRAASESEKEALLKRLTSPIPNQFAVPFDTRHLGEYHYMVNGKRVKFTSIVKDASHGNGFFTLGPSGAVTYIQYVPRTLPRFATDGLVRENRSQVLPKFWATVKSDEFYNGRYLIFRGHGEFITANADFHRFNAIAAAKAWLQAER